MGTDCSLGLALGSTLNLLCLHHIILLLSNEFCLLIKQGLTFLSTGSVLCWFYYLSRLYWVCNCRGKSLLLRPSLTFALRLGLAAPTCVSECSFGYGFMISSGMYPLQNKYTATLGGRRWTLAGHDRHCRDQALSWHWFLVSLSSEWDKTEEERCKNRDLNFLEPVLSFQAEGKKKPAYLFQLNF